MTTTRIIGSDEPFPLDWVKWITQWSTWLRRHESEFKPGNPRMFPAEKNILADYVLGQWVVNGHDVELSEVTFGMASPVRGVGITWGPHSTTRGSAEMAWSFLELELILSRGPARYNDSDDTHV